MTYKIWIESLQSNKMIRILGEETLCGYIVSTKTFNYQIIDRRIAFSYCILLFDKSKEQSIQIETTVTWPISNLNTMNIDEGMYCQFMVTIRPKEHIRLRLTKMTVKLLK